MPMVSGFWREASASPISHKGQGSKNQSAGFRRHVISTWKRAERAAPFSTWAGQGRDSWGIPASACVVASNGKAVPPCLPACRPRRRCLRPGSRRRRIGQGQEGVHREPPNRMPDLVRVHFHGNMPSRARVAPLRAPTIRTWHNCGHRVFGQRKQPAGPGSRLRRRRRPCTDVAGLRLPGRCLRWRFAARLGQLRNRPGRHAYSARPAGASCCPCTQRRHLRGRDGSRHAPPARTAHAARLRPLPTMVQQPPAAWL